MKDRDFLTSMRVAAGQDGMPFEQVISLKSKLEDELGVSMSREEVLVYFSNLDQAVSALEQLQRDYKETFSDESVGIGHQKDPLFPNAIIRKVGSGKKGRGGFNRPAEEEAEKRLDSIR